VLWQNLAKLYAEIMDSDCIPVNDNLLRATCTGAGTILLHGGHDVEGPKNHYAKMGYEVNSHQARWSYRLAIVK
jgi:hypothetical protein